MTDRERNIYVGVGTIEGFSACELPLGKVDPGIFITHMMDHVLNEREGATWVMMQSWEIAEREVTSPAEVGDEWLVLFGEDGFVSMWLCTPEPRRIGRMSIEDNRRNRESSDGSGAPLIILIDAGMVEAAIEAGVPIWSIGPVGAEA